jgi:peroxiredoxin
MPMTVGTKAPNLKVSHGVQGETTNIDQEKGNVVLLEVFQVNCPGCFMYGLPQSIEIYKKFRNGGLVVLGISTAFEDYDKNTLDNLRLLLKTGEVIGETKRSLLQYGKLVDGNKLAYKIPFPVAMDSLVRLDIGLTQSRIMDVIEANIPNYRSYSEQDRQIMFERARYYLQSKQYSAQTFEEYGLRGTPSTVIIDRKGIIRHIIFGTNVSIMDIVETLL